MFSGLGSIIQSSHQEWSKKGVFLSVTIDKPTSPDRLVLRPATDLAYLWSRYPRLMLLLNYRIIGEEPEIRQILPGLGLSPEAVTQQIRSALTIENFTDSDLLSKELGQRDQYWNQMMYYYQKLGGRTLSDLLPPTTESDKLSEKLAKATGDTYYDVSRYDPATGTGARKTSYPGKVGLIGVERARLRLLSDNWPAYLAAVESIPGARLTYADEIARVQDMFDHQPPPQPKKRGERKKYVKPPPTPFQLEMEELKKGVAAKREANRNLLLAQEKGYQPPVTTPFGISAFPSVPFGSPQTSQPVQANPAPVYNLLAPTQPSMASPTDPTVVHLKRAKGEVVQSCDTYIGRKQNMGGWNLQASKWANPYSVKKYGLEESLRLYEQYIRSKPELMQALPELEGQTLGCWCKPDPCHGDVLVKLYQEQRGE